MNRYCVASSNKPNSLCAFLAEPLLLTSNLQGVDSFFLRAVSGGVHYMCSKYMWHFKILILTISNQNRDNREVLM